VESRSPAHQLPQQVPVVGVHIPLTMINPKNKKKNLVLNEIVFFKFIYYAKNEPYKT
jgi:hypothetical protein